jgi:hypothetical protein
MGSYDEAAVAFGLALNEVCDPFNRYWYSSAIVSTKIFSRSQFAKSVPPMQKSDST